MGSEKSIEKFKGTRGIPRAYAFGKKRYELVASFLKRRMAARLQKELEKNGYMSRIKEFSGIWAVYKLMVKS